MKRENYPLLCDYMGECFTVSMHTGKFSNLYN